MECKLSFRLSSTPLLNYSRFRLAACHLITLSKCLDEASLDATLDCLPETIQKSYTHTLNTVDLKVRPRVINLLQLLAWSHRPLFASELIDALAVRLEPSPIFEESKRLFEIALLIEHCSSFINILNSSEDTDNKQTEISLSHASVK